MLNKIKENYSCKFKQIMKEEKILFITRIRNVFFLFFK